MKEFHKHRLTHRHSAASPSQSNAATNFPDDTHNPESFRGIRGVSEIRGKILVRKTLEISHLQTMPLPRLRFWPKNRALLQKNRGPTEIIFHFFLRFPSFWGLSPLQPIASQRPATNQPLRKKSCQKHYRRFFVRSRLCHHRRVNVEMTGRNQRCKGRTTLYRHPPRAKRFGVRNGSSAFGHRSGIMERIFNHGIHGFHGSNVCRFLSVQSVKSVVAFLQLRLVSLLSFVAQIDPPPTAIQPSPVAVITIQHKSVQVNITTQKNFGPLQ